MFWSSADLTGNQTSVWIVESGVVFWSSADLTGNQTKLLPNTWPTRFWSSADLTGNQTGIGGAHETGRFGAVPI